METPSCNDKYQANDRSQSSSLIRPKPTSGRDSRELLAESSFSGGLRSLYGDCKGLML
jgi:hypothetical protein